MLDRTLIPFGSFAGLPAARWSPGVAPAELLDEVRAGARALLVDGVEPAEVDAVAYLLWARAEAFNVVVWRCGVLGDEIWCANEGVVQVVDLTAAVVAAGPSVAEFAAALAFAPALPRPHELAVHLASPFAGLAGLLDEAASRLDPREDGWVFSSPRADEAARAARTRWRAAWPVDPAAAR